MARPIANGDCRLRARPRDRPSHPAVTTGRRSSRASAARVPDRRRSRHVRRSSAWRSRYHGRTRQRAPQPAAENREQLGRQPAHLLIPVQVVVASGVRQPVLRKGGKPDPDPAHRVRSCRGHPGIIACACIVATTPSAERHHRRASAAGKFPGPGAGCDTRRRRARQPRPTSRTAARRDHATVTSCRAGGLVCPPEIYRIKERLGAGAPACGRRRTKQLTSEDVRQPLLVPVGGPASVADEQPVDLRRHERVDDVRGVALVQLRPQPARRGPGTGRSALGPACRLPGVLGEQRRRVGIGAGGADEDPVDGSADRELISRQMPANPASCLPGSASAKSARACGRDPAGAPPRRHRRLRRRAVP